jgi:hypothetical protein
MSEEKVIELGLHTVHGLVFLSLRITSIFDTQIIAFEMLPIKRLLQTLECIQTQLLRQYCISINNTIEQTTH